MGYTRADIGGALSNYAQQMAEGYKYKKYLEAQEPQRLLNVMHAAQSGAYPTEEGLQQAGGQFLPQVTGIGGISQLLNPNPSMQMPGQINMMPGGGLMNLSPPLSTQPQSAPQDPRIADPINVDINGNRSPANSGGAAFKQRPKTQVEQARDNLGNQVLMKELDAINQQIANPPKALSQDELLSQQGVSYDTLSKMYPGMVDVENRRLHPFLQAQLATAQTASEKRQNALMARKDQLLNMIALSGIKQTVQPSYIDQPQPGVNPGKGDSTLKTMISALQKEQQQIVVNSGIAQKLEGFDPRKLKNPQQRQRFQDLQTQIDKLIGLPSGGAPAPAPGPSAGAASAAPSVEARVRANPGFSVNVQNYLKTHPTASQDQAEQTVLGLMKAKLGY